LAEGPHSQEWEALQTLALPQSAWVQHWVAGSMQSALQATLGEEHTQAPPWQVAGGLQAAQKEKGEQLQTQLPSSQ